MEQQELNMRIAMSLLRQCAWVWEYCTRNPNEGEFNLSDIIQGLTGRKRFDSKPGMVLTEFSLCEYWDVFNKKQPIEGLTYNHKNGEATLTFGTYRLCYFLIDIFTVTKNFCKWNCPNMANKTRFCYKDGERWTVLPEVKKQAAPKARRTKKQAATISLTSTKCSTVSLSIADRLRAALAERLAA